jgi:transketolase
MSNHTKETQIRRDVLQASFDANACHIGSSLSCVEIMVGLFYGRMNDGDRFLFVKASGSACYYSILADKGYFPKEKTAEYLRNYPEVSKEVPGVLHTIGSVGMGLSVAVGLALSDRSQRVFCLISDGQLNEGVTYEAALFSRQHKLTNLFVICDNNGIQALARTDDVLNLDTAFKFFEKTFPNFENVKTIKGSGVSFLEDRVESHYMNLTQELLDKALDELK